VPAGSRHRTAPPWALADSARLHNVPGRLDGAVGVRQSTPPPSALEPATGSVAYPFVRRPNCYVGHIAAVLVDPSASDRPDRHAAPPAGRNP
jgi:hypothetical protein